MVVLRSGELGTDVQAGTGSSGDLFQEALGRLMPAGHEVKPSEVMPEAVMREHTVMGGALSDLTIQTLSNSLASELEYIVALQKKDPKSLEPWMATLYNQAVSALGKKEGEPLDYEDLYSVANDALNSDDPTTSRTWEEIGDRAVKHQLARIEVYTQGKVELTSTPDQLEYQPRETKVPQVSQHGETKPPQYTGPKGGRLKQWWNRRRNDPTNTDIVEARGWIPPWTRFRKHQLFNGLTPKFPEDATIDFSRTLDGDGHHRAEVWMSNLPELRRGSGAPVGEFDQKRLGERMIQMAAAISEISDRRHDEPLSQADDFRFSREVLDTNGQPTGEYETTGRGRYDVQLHIDGVANPFPVDFATMKPDEQLNILTNVLDQKARKEFREVERNMFLAGPIEQNIAEARSALVKSTDPKRFDAEIEQHDQKLKQLREREELLGGFISAKDAVKTQEKSVADLTQQKEAYADQLTSLDGDHQTFITKTAEKQQIEIDIQGQQTTLTQRNDRLAGLRAQRKSKSPPADLETQITEMETVDLPNVNAELTRLKKELVTLNVAIDQVKAAEARYQSVQTRVDELQTSFNQTEIQQKIAQSKQDKQKEALLKKYNLDPTSTEAAILAQIETFLKDAPKLKTAVAEEIAKGVLAQSELRARAGKPDAGIAWRLNRLQSCQELLLNSNSYMAIEQRADQGRVDISFDPARVSERPVHSAAPYIKAAHKAMPNLPPAYLHAVYVFAGPGALERTNEGKILFKKASELLTPADFYVQIRKNAAYTTRLQTALGVASPDDLPVSIYDPEFSSNVVVMDEMMAMMDERFLESLVDFSLYSAKDGYDNDPEQEFAKAIAESQVVLDSEVLEQVIKQETAATKQAQVELSLDVVNKIHTSNIELAAIADTHKFGHEIALRASGQMKMVMDKLNVMKVADIPGALPQLVAAIDTIVPGLDDDGGPVDKNAVATAIAEKLLNHPATGSDLTQQADGIFQLPADMQNIRDIERWLTECKILPNGTVVRKDPVPKWREARVAQLEAELTKLVQGGYAMSEAVMVANDISAPGDALGRFADSQKLIDSLTHIFPATTEAEKELLILSSILPSVETSMLQALSGELAGAIAKRKQPDMGMIFGIPSGDIIENKYNQRLTEIVAAYNKKTGGAIVDISTLFSSEIVALVAAVNEQSGLSAEVSKNLLQAIVTNGERDDMVRFYDPTLAHLDGAELAIEIQADTGYDRKEALIVAHMILEKRKLRATGQEFVVPERMPMQGPQRVLGPEEETSDVDE